jgi:hypothetical protein
VNGMAILMNLLMKLPKRRKVIRDNQDHCKSICQLVAVE